MMSCSEEAYVFPEDENLVPTKAAQLTDITGVSQSVTKISDIQNWTGTGSNSSVLAIQWVTAADIEQPTNDEIHFLAWGYHWDNPAPKGINMITAIAKKDTRLYVVVAEEWGGVAIKGFAYDGNNDGKISICRGVTTVLTEESFTNGIYRASSSESFDGLTTSNSADLWMGLAGCLCDLLVRRNNRC